MGAVSHRIERLDPPLLWIGGLCRAGGERTRPAPQVSNVPSTRLDSRVSIKRPGRTLDYAAGIGL